MEGRGYVCGAIELVIGVDGECGGVMRGLQRTGVFGVGDSGYAVGRRGGRHAWSSKHGVIFFMYKMSTNVYNLLEVQMELAEELPD